MFNEVYESTKSIMTGIPLEQVLDEASFNIDQIRKEIANPDMRPGAFDVTFDGWLARIGLWGKIKIVWNNPEGFGKKKLNQRQFLRHISDPNLLQAFGQWEIQQYAVNKMEMYRNYVGLNGKKYTDKFMMEIDLKPELKKALK